jgi:hypothetical protein
MELLALVTVIVLLDVAALALGRDSRDGNDWIDHRVR